METELGAADFSRTVLQAIEANGVSQHVHIRQLVYVDAGGEMFTQGPVGDAVVVTPKSG